MVWKIGDIEVGGPVVSGPMSGYTSRSYRDFMKPFGVAVSMTEMTSAVGILNSDAKTGDYVMFDRNYPTGLQLFGHSENDLAEAAAKALRWNPNIDFFDINMGCPVHKILRSGAGSVLMKDPPLCGKMVKKVKEATKRPVTAKIRLGSDINHMNYLDVIKELEASDVDAITVHARTKDQNYSGYPHYDVIEGLQNEMSVPLIVSGNIYSLEDAIDAKNVTNATGVMVARGGVGNPFLCTQIDEYFKTGNKLKNPTVHQQIEWCIQLADMLIDEKGEDCAIRKLRSIAPKFVSGCHRCREYRLRLATETVDREHLISILQEIDDKMGYEQINMDGRRTYYPIDVPQYN
ncbi:MAG: tRNA-dihydrouridine synthase family protein [Candidatus Methanomethylophilaceae archaeon]|nr:tRNA-dihydrouridine synthase family protein [Candidatus Methanomethylophilaceae archaeon]